MKKVLWTFLGLVVLIVAAGFAVPHFAADSFGAGAQKALETSLKRRVKIGKVEYNLFTGPGFRIKDVVIWDDPALSAEPILYAGWLTAIPRIWPLFTGKLTFSSIRLEDAHINLGRTASPDRPAQWNVGALTRPALFQAFPNISVVSGGVTGDIPKSRINFKIGGVKTVFYILISRLEVRPPASGDGAWSIRLEGEPARTDRPALGFGSFVADGRWLPGDGLADITVRLERSEVSDIITLLYGHDAGLHGSVTGTARIAGRLAELKINGRLEVSGLHGWDQMASTSQNWPLAIAGNWNLPGQLFELNGRFAGQPNSPVQAHFRVADYLGAPHWGVGVTFDAMPLQPFLPLARQVGLGVPDGVQLNGTLDGALGFSRTGPADGSARITKPSLAVTGGPKLEFEDADVIVANGHAKLAPSAIRVLGIEEGSIQGDYDLDRQQIKVAVTSRGMDIGTLHRYAEVAAIPVLRDLQSGVWRGQVSYSQTPGPAGGWSGSVDVQRAVIALPFLATPVRVASAHADLEGTSLTVRKIQARSGDLAVTGDYRYDAPALRPHVFHLTAGRVTGPQLEGLLRPTLYRGGLVSRLGLTRSEVPGWLAHTRADGIVDVATLDLGGLNFEHLTSRVIWDGGRVKLANTKARFEGASLVGLLEVDLSGNSPAYHGSGDVTGMPWKGGRVDADLSFDTAGAGMETLANVRAEGSFRARDIDVVYPSMMGCFQFLLNGKTPRVTLSSLQVSDGEETFVGSGATGANGELSLDLAGVAKPVKLSLR